MAFRSQVLVKSGGFSTQVAKYVPENVEGDPLYSSRFDITYPEAVIQTHIDFLKSGSQMLNSNTYQASVEGYMKYLHLSREEAIEMIRNSVKLVKTAKERFLKVSNKSLDEKFPLIIASCGPYGACLHDFSEYSGSYADKMTPEELREWHKPRVEAFLAEGVDIIGFETIPCQIEAEAIMELMEEYKDANFYISFQCKDDKSLAHGENFNDVVAKIWNKVKANIGTESCVGIGVNCVNPRNVASLFESLHPAEKGTVPLLVYSNRDEVYNKDEGEWQFNESARSLDSFVSEWIDLGVRIIGGCCRVYPEDIRKIREKVDEINKKI